MEVNNMINNDAGNEKTFLVNNILGQNRNKEKRPKFHFVKHGQTAMPENTS